MYKAKVLVFWLILILGMSFLVSAHEYETHDQLSARLFTVHKQYAELSYIDLPDNHLEGSFSLETFSDVIVNNQGRFIVAVDKESSQASIWSTGLLLEEHGDHYDLVAVNPSFYWDFSVGGNPGQLVSNENFVVSVNSEGTVSVIEPESGVMITIPLGREGRALLVDDLLIAIDQKYDLLDVFNLAIFDKKVTLRIPHGAHGMEALDDYLWLASNEGVTVYEISHFDEQLLAVGWLEAPKQIYVQPESFWVYGVSNSTLYALSTKSGEVIEFDTLVSTVWNVNDDGYYLAIVGSNGKEIQIVDIGHGEPFQKNVISLVEVLEHEISDIIWHEEILYVAAGSQVYVMDKDGCIEKNISLDKHIDKLLISSIDEE